MALKNTKRPKGPVFWIALTVCVLVAAPFVFHLIVLCAVVAFTLLNPSSAGDDREPIRQVESRQSRTVEQPEWASDLRPAVEIEPVASEYPTHPIYEIASGETVYSVARKFDVKPEELLRVNGITDPTNISVGTRLRIPPKN